jgi:hypothetical protein
VRMWQMELAACAASDSARAFPPEYRPCRVSLSLRWEVKKWE